MENKCENHKENILIFRYFNDLPGKKYVIPSLIISIIFIHDSIIPSDTFCQQGNLSEIIRNISEELATDESDPEAVTGFTDRLRELAEDPVNLNSQDEAELSKLFFLSDFQIKILLEYIRTSGRIMTPYEIQNIPGFDRTTAELMIPFVTFSEAKNTTSPRPVKPVSAFLTNLSYKYPHDAGHIGSPLKIMSRYKLTAGPFLAGFTAEKDAGERFPGTRHPVPDFFSAYLSYSGKGLLKRIIIGDYAARFGYGTNINTGIRTALSVASPGNLQGQDEIKGYTSTDENNFFRGGAAEFSVKKIRLMAFYSKNKCDASIVRGSDSSEILIENFYKAGLHNTDALLLKKDVFTETNFGLNLSFSSENFRTGLLWSATDLSVPVTERLENPENLYDFNGNYNSIYTIYYKKLIKKILLTGEFSANPDFSFALVQGISLRPSDRLSINFLYRRYDPAFVSFHGRGPGTGSYTSNEEGIMGNFTFEVAGNLFLSAGCDIQKYPWLRFCASSPSAGKKHELRISYCPVENFSVETSYHYRLTMSDKKKDTGIPLLSNTVSNLFKTTIRYSPDPGLHFGTRIDYRITSPPYSKGMLLLQDVSYRFGSVPLSLWFRYCIFETESWESRLYTWENDLLYSFSIPVLSGEGSRSYIMVQLKIRDFGDIRIKYASKVVSDKDQTPGNTREIRMQFISRF